MNQRQRIRALLEADELRRLFIEELGWDNPVATGPLQLMVGTRAVPVVPLAEKRGIFVYTCDLLKGGFLSAVERRIFERQLQGFAFEHIVIFNSGTVQQWLWASKEPGRPRVVRTFIVQRGVAHEALVQKLLAVAFSIEDEDALLASEVSKRAQYAFNVEDITRRFYEEFKREHQAFLEGITGIRRTSDREWYASIVLNRLMFMYFVQRKGFLDGDPAYLQNRFRSHCERRSNKSFFKSFFLNLCHEGLGSSQRSAESKRLYGNIKYVNGGLFEVHRLEQVYRDTLDINDVAFESVFEFFSGWDWHLDIRPTAGHNEINPDVLGYIFEKYVNQKQMGAFYTKEDVTQYVALQTIIRALIDNVSRRSEAMRKVVVTIGDLLRSDAQRYSLRIDGGIKAVEGAADDPMPSGVNTLQLLIDVIEDAGALDAVFIIFDELRSLRILDPTCGSGAFLFAALNLLFELYEACLERMQAALSEKISAFQREIIERTLADVNQHANRNYYILKRIIVQNLHGVDIMDEAVEICKLRLFLKLVAQVDDVTQLEPLPDVDFNIRAGNTLVGFATRSEIEDATRQQHRLSLDLNDQIKAIDSLVEKCADAFANFQAAQFSSDRDAEKFSKLVLIDLSNALSQRLDQLQYATLEARRGFETWRRDAKPFHWYAAFFGLIRDGGFDVIIGNPPFVDYKNVRKQYEVQNYRTIRSNNLYAFVLERCLKLLKPRGQFGMIVPLSITFSRDFSELRALFDDESGTLAYSSYDNIPDRLFTGVKESENTSKANQQRITIIVLDRSAPRRRYSTALLRWKSRERERLFSELQFVEVSSVISNKCWPKLGSSRMLDFWLRLEEADSRLGSVFQDEGPDSLVVARTAGYYISAYPSELDRTKQVVLRFHSKAERDLAFVLINSNVFFWRWRVVGDAFDVTTNIIREFPVPRLEQDTVSELAKALEEAIPECSVYKNYRGVAVPNVNFNKRLDLLYAVDQSIIDAVSPEGGFTPEDFAWAKSNSCFGFEIAKTTVRSP